MLEDGLEACQCHGLKTLIFIHRGSCCCGNGCGGGCRVELLPGILSKDLFPIPFCAQELFRSLVLVIDGGGDCKLLSPCAVGRYYHRRRVVGGSSWGSKIEAEVLRGDGSGGCGRVVGLLCEVEIADEGEEAVFCTDGFHGCWLFLMETIVVRAGCC